MVIKILWLVAVWFARSALGSVTRRTSMKSRTTEGSCNGDVSIFHITFYLHFSFREILSQSKLLGRSHCIFEMRSA